MSSLDMTDSLRDKKKVVTGYVRQVVILYSKDCMGICLGGFSTDHLRQVVILSGLAVV